MKIILIGVLIMVFVGAMIDVFDGGGVGVQSSDPRGAGYCAQNPYAKDCSPGTPAGDPDVIEVPKCLRDERAC